MPPKREPDFVFLPVDQAEPLIAAAQADGRLSTWTYGERLVRRRPPDFEAEEVVKVPRFLVEAAQTPKALRAAAGPAPSGSRPSR